MSLPRVAPLPVLALLFGCPSDDPSPVADGGTQTEGTSTSGSSSDGAVDTTMSAETGPLATSGTSGEVTGSVDSTGSGETGDVGVSLFRVSTVGLVAPNFYLPGCGLANDSLPIFINPALVADEDGDGIYDLSIVASIELTDPAGNIRFGEGECTTTPEQCSLSSADFDTTFESMARGECYVPDAELFITASDVSQTAVSAPCLVASGDALTINLGAFSLPLIHAMVSTTTAAEPTDTTSVDGVVQGFLTLDVAEATFLPKSETFDALGISGQPLSNFLPRPFFECESIQGYSMSPEGELGWYVLLTFAAPEVDEAAR